LWPAMTMERLTICDFIARLPCRSGVGRDLSGPWSARAPAGWTRPAARLGAVSLAYAQYGG
jgi:hypothetical protein